MDVGFKLTPKRTQILTQLKLDSSFSIVNYLPSRYDDFTLSPLDIEHHDKRVVIKGTLLGKGNFLRFHTGFQKFTLDLQSGQDYIKIIVFNRSYLYSSLKIGSNLLIAGKFNYYKKELVAVDILTNNIDNFEVRTRYSLFEGVKNYEFQKLVLLAFNDCDKKQELNEIIPHIFIQKYRLWPRKTAYYKAHFPQKMADVVQAMRYLKYEELLLYSLMMQKMKSMNKEIVGDKNKIIQENYLTSMINHLPFQPTNSQIVAINEIKKDIQSKQVMYRLLQGDVGSGKTLVAALALACNHSAGYQGAFMAPTELLAQQHYETIRRFFTFDSTIQIVLLTSSTPAKEKKIILERLALGEIDLVIGTHALIQKGIVFHKLGLAVIDEQHRFGVAQRKILREKGEHVELLMMSATPIPRTLAISLFGDMDVSTLHDFPASKRKVITIVIPEENREQLYKKMAENIEIGGSVFVVCPLIEEEDNRPSVHAIYQTIDKHFKNRYSVALLHGKMSNAEKDTIMHQFKQGKIKILVSTTVIEVGIDIKSATMMVVYDAHRFGLAQLHQLRGRVGRGGQQAYCYLVDASSSQEAKERLEYLTTHDDGFDIARFDLAHRGQGDIAGLRQSGVYDFNIASVYDDLKILEVARDDAKLIYLDYTNQENRKIIDYVDTIMAKTIAIIE